MPAVGLIRASWRAKWFAAFLLVESRVRHPLIRLGILRKPSLVRASLAIIAIAVLSFMLFLALFEPGLFKPGVLSDQLILNRATAIGASAVALHHRIARASLVEKAKADGLAVAVWTVDDPAWIARTRSLGIEALITNNPAAMLAHR